MKTEDFDPRVVELVRWVSAALLFLFWGAFFVEHLSCFFDTAGSPPSRVWLLQGLHLLLLLSFVLAWKWELWGALLIAGSAALFLSQTAGPNFPRLFALNLIPAALFFLSWWLGRHATPAAAAGVS